MIENRPSKKQQELLSFIDGFIKGNGYGPSYREVMRALDYKSVSTVAVHIDGLITRGLLRKTDNSARSLEVVPQGIIPNPNNSHIDWLKQEIKQRQEGKTSQSESELEILGRALVILQKQIQNEERAGA
jgi:repressor LexA